MSNLNLVQQDTQPKEITRKKSYRISADPEYQGSCYRDDHIIGEGTDWDYLDIGSQKSEGDIEWEIFSYMQEQMEYNINVDTVYLGDDECWYSEYEFECGDYPEAGDLYANPLDDREKVGFLKYLEDRTALPDLEVWLPQWLVDATEAHCMYRHIQARRGPLTDESLAAERERMWTRPQLVEKTMYAVVHHTEQQWAFSIKDRSIDCPHIKSWTTFTGEKGAHETEERVEYRVFARLQDAIIDCYSRNQEEARKDIEYVEAKHYYTVLPVHRVEGSDRLECYEHNTPSLPPTLNDNQLRTV